MKITTIRTVSVRSALTVNGRRVVDDSREGPADPEIDAATEATRKAVDEGDLPGILRALADEAAWAAKGGRR